jgi:drug/metabolite transporter (DMT)-like permease
MIKTLHTDITAGAFSRRALGHSFLAASLFFGVGGQLLLKFAVDEMRVHPDMWLSYFWLLCGLGVYAVGIGSWMLCLSYLDLSYAYPFTGLNYVMVLGASWLLFGEALSLQRITGVVVICLGIALIPSRSGRN